VSDPSCDKLVMVVEDDPDVRESLLEVLEDFEYHPLAASNGQEALERLREPGARPCLILLDVMMPVMDGWGFRAAQEADLELKSIPVVVLSAHNSAEQTAREMGVDGYLRKPVKLAALMEMVTRYCAPA
jgi:CheY-like chemotaxis protein